MLSAEDKYGCKDNDCPHAATLNRLATDVVGAGAH